MWEGEAPKQGNVKRVREREKASACVRVKEKNVQDGKLSRLETEDGEEGEADDKQSEGGQVEAAEEEKAIPATYCRVASARCF